MNPDVYLQIVHVHSPIVCSSTSQDVWDDCTQVLDQGLSFSLLGIFFTIRLLIETFKKERKALWCLQFSPSGSVELSFYCARTTVTKSIQSEAETAIHDTSRRGGAVAEVALTWGRLAEWEQRHTVTCWWINTQNFVWGHYSYPPKNLCLSHSGSPLLTLSLPGNVSCLTQCVSTGDYFLTSSLLFALFFLRL